MNFLKTTAIIIVTIMTIILLGGCGLSEIGKKTEKPIDEYRKEYVERPYKNQPTYSSIDVFVDTTGITSWFDDYSARIASKNSILYCSGYGCQVKTTIKLDSQQLNHIIQEFNNSSPQDERNSIKLAIMKYENITGEVVGTASDKPGAGFFGNGNKTQLNNTDKTINTTNFLVNLFENGVIRHHSIMSPQWRSKWCVSCESMPIIRNEEKEYIVDSNKGNNGSEPIIVEKEIWTGS